MNEPYYVMKHLLNYIDLFLVVQTEANWFWRLSMVLDKRLGTIHDGSPTVSRDGQIWEPEPDDMPVPIMVTNLWRVARPEMRRKLEIERAKSVLEGE